MTGMIAQFLAWPTLGIALLVFGFAPGVVLRLIVLFYRRDNLRRRELLGELYAVPRIERPFWVAEQLEVALFEGLRGRLKARRNRRTPRTDLRVEHEWMQLEKLGKVEVSFSGWPKPGAKPTEVHLAASEDLFASLVADDVARGWRGRGWRGAQAEEPTKKDEDPSTGV